jgi:hypothetical protein
MALTEVKKAYFYQIDISIAFCCADIEGKVHIYAPKGIDIPKGKCFNGLHTSPKSWNKIIDKTLRGLHFEPTVSNICSYSRWVRGKLHLFVYISIDDILIASEDEGYLLEMKKVIYAEYDMIDMGELDNFLNAKITRTRE